MVKIHEHPESREIVTGIRLKPGEKIQRGDVYNSTTGYWRTNSSVIGDTVPNGGHIIWIRPIQC